MADDIEETETNVRVLPTKASRQGQLPTYKGCPTVAQEHALIAKIVAKFRDQGMDESDIAVLYPRREQRRVDDLCQRLRKDFRVCWISNESDPDGGVLSISKPGVRLMTIHAAKGLEFPAVIVSAVDQLPHFQEREEMLDSNLLYVGLTRAMDHLVVTWAARSPFTERILRSTKAIPIL